MKTPLYKVEYRYKDGSWITIHESSLPDMCYNIYKHEVTRHSSEPNCQFRCLVWFGGDYHTIDI